MLSPVDPHNAPLAAIFGLSGTTLTDEERAFFKTVNPLGFILFARNATDPAQLSALTADLQSLLGREVPILIDQEGGRVARLRQPHWPATVAAQHLPDTASVAAQSGAIADTLNAMGVNVNCAPVLDVLFDDTHAAIGDRAFSNDAAIVSERAIASCRAYLAKGIVPVIKHMPGQGRATLDSHFDLPHVKAAMADLEAVDFLPYRDLLKQDFVDAVWGMVSHIVYDAVDNVLPATCSPALIGGVIRQQLGFDGLLLTDDIVMNALGRIGDMGVRAKATLDAGCDIVLHCSGKMDEMKNVAAAIPTMTADAVRRYNRSLPTSGQGPNVAYGGLHV